jgi:hypothetical protein
MSGDGTERGGAGLPDESADGTDWLLSQLDDDDTEAIETQPDTDAVDEHPSAASVPSLTDDDDRTRVLPVVGDTDAPAAASPVSAEPQWSAPAVPDAAATPTAVEPTPTPAAPATGPGEFASEAELLAWWQRQVPNPADDATPAAAPPTPDVPSAEPAAPATPPATSDPQPEAAPVRSEGLRHPNALELPVVPPTPAPASPVPPVRNELTVDTDSVLQHAPVGTFRPAPTNPVVLPPVDDEPWSLGGGDDAAPTAPEDVSTAVLPTARALAADDPAAWAAVEAEETGTTTSTPAVDTPATSIPPAAPPVAPTPTAADLEDPSGSATPVTEVQDDDLPEGSWSLSETFGDDVLGGETVEVRETTTGAVAPADTRIDDPADGTTSDAVSPDESGSADTSAPRTDPLAWLTEPFGDTFGAPSAAPAEQPSVEPSAAPVEAEPQHRDPADEPTTDEPATPASIDTVQPTADATADSEPASDGIVASEPVTPAAPFRWDTVAAASPASAAEPSSPAEVPWPETVPDVDAEPLDETRPFDSLGGPGFSALAGAAAAAAGGPPVPTPDADAERVQDDLPADDRAEDTTEVPPAFGPPAPKAERSITELISLDGVQPEPTVSPFGTAPFVWDLAPNDALDPLVHAAPTTQPIPVPPVEWEGAESSAVSAESPSELALEGEVPDAAFIAGDVQPFAPGLAAVTLGRPLVDGPGDELASWTDDATETDSSQPDDAPIVPAANDTVDLFPTLSLGGFDAAVAAGGLAAAGAAAGATSGLGSEEDTADAVSDTDGTEPSADLDADAATATAPTPVAGTPAPETPAYAVDPEELDDEFDEEIVEFDAVPLAAAGVTPLPSVVPDGAVADGASDTAADASASDVPPADEGSVDPAPVGEPEPVSEELRLESLFDLGPDTDAVEVPSTDDAPADGDQADSDQADDAEQADDAAKAEPSEPSDQPDETDHAEAASARSLAEAFAAEGGWSLRPDAVADPDLPLAPVPGLIAAEGTDVDGTGIESDADGSRRDGAPVAGDGDGSTPTPDVDAGPAAADLAPTAVTPASVSVFGAHAAVPSQGPVADAPQTAPAALPGETVAFPELDGASALTTPAAAAGIVGATLPPQATTSAPDRDLPEYRGEHAEQGIPKALIWAVVGLGAAVLLLLAFYFGTLVGAANAAGAAADDATPNTSAARSTVVGAPDTV